MKKTLIIESKYKNILKEYYETNDQDYYNALETFFSNYSNDSKNIVNALDQNDKSFIQMFKQQYNENPVVKTISSDGGNLIMKYAEFVGGKFIMILGIVKRGDLNRKDLQSFKNFVDVILEKITSGYSLQASSNEKSMEFVKKIVKIGKKKGINLNLDVLAQMEFPFPIDAGNEDKKKYFTYKHFVLYAE